MNITYLSKDDAKYPESLKDLPIKGIYFCGDLACLNNAVAIIGKRVVTSAVLKEAFIVGQNVALLGYPVLNGLALGCDTESIKGALSVNGKVVAILPSSIDNIYPSQNKILAKEIIEKGGCLISPYSKEEKLQKYNFIFRDKMQAALSRKIISIYADYDGGTMHTLKYGYAYNKPIGCFSNIKSEGNSYLLSKGKAEIIDDLSSFVKYEEPTQMSLFT